MELCSDWQGHLIHERFVDMMGHGIFNVDGEKWLRQRKVAILEFSSGKLRDYSTHAFRRQALKLVGILIQSSKTHRVVDMQVWKP